MANAELYVAMYRPRFGNCEHWALWLDYHGDHTIYEVIDKHPTFKKNQLKVNPRDTDGFLRSYRVGTVDADYISLLDFEVNRAKVDNANVNWNSQHYVVELVEQLVREEVLEEEEEHEKVRSRIYGHLLPSSPGSSHSFPSR